MLLLMHMCSAHKRHACRFASLGQYTTWELLMREWKEGIHYSFGNKQTVPLEQLEKDLQEGIQQKSTACFKSQKEPWRRGITDRTAIMDRGMYSAKASAAEQWCWVTAHLYEQQTFIGAFTVTHACCETVSQSSTGQWGMHSAKASAAEDWCRVTAHLYEQQTFIGVFTVTHACCETVSQSSTGH